MTGGPPTVFTRKAVANETFNRKSNNFCKSIVGIDASQFYPYSMCQVMPTGYSMCQVILFHFFINEKEIETSVIKKANDFVSFKFGDVQLLDIMKFLGGATTLDSFLKAYKASEMKG